MRHPIVFSILLLASCAIAHAGTPIDQSRPLDVHGSVSVSNVSGEVTVTGWDRPQVRITGTLGEGAKPLKIEGDENSLSIKVEAKKSSGGWFSLGNESHMKPTTLNILVPIGAAINLDLVSSNARVENLTGGKIGIDSVSGRVHVKADSPEISIDAVSGDVTIAGKTDRLDVDTVSGDVHAPMIGKRGKLESVSGDITVAGGPFEQMNASTVSGDLDIRGGITASGKMDIETMSGDVSLLLPKSASARIDASTFSGDIESALGQASHQQHGSGSELSTRIGTGGGNISLESFSGDIRIRLSAEAGN
ncbi:MAG: DUF4097 family beta strand repeat-containing protein [Rhodanobacteraceae bacterium]